MEKKTADISSDYKTIKVTKSRINKGLLAIPISLHEYFPKEKGEINVTTGLKDEISPKTFTPYSSSSRECRVGGMRKFYEKFNIKDGNEIVLQILADNVYRFIPEKQFKESLTETEKEFDKASDQKEANSKLEEISNITNTKSKRTLFNEYSRLAGRKMQNRKRRTKPKRDVSEKVSPSLRKILAEIYGGKCQLTGFTFLKKDGIPYFEVHHIKPHLEDHVKNILVVSPNIHAQFSYAPLKQSFDSEGWLREVQFNEKVYTVNQIIDKIPKKFKKEIHFDR